MGANAVGNLNAYLGLDGSKFQEGLAKADAQAKAFSGKLQATLTQGITNLSSTLSSPGAALTAGLSQASPMIAGLLSNPATAAAGAVAATAAAVRSLVDELGRLAEEGAKNINAQGALARRFDLTAQEAGGLQFAANARGVSEEGLTAGLTVLSRRLGEVRENADDASNATVQMFRRFQIDARQLERGSEAEAFRVLADRFRGMSAAQRNVASRAILGRQGQEVVPLLMRGGAELDRLQGQGQASGVISSQAEIDQIRQVNEARREARAAEESINDAIGRRLALLNADRDLAVAGIRREWAEVKLTVVNMAVAAAGEGPGANRMALLHNPVIDRLLRFVGGSQNTDAVQGQAVTQAAMELANENAATAEQRRARAADTNISRVESSAQGQQDANHHVREQAETAGMAADEVERYHMNQRLATAQSAVMAAAAGNLTQAERERLQAAVDALKTAQQELPILQRKRELMQEAAAAEGERGALIQQTRTPQEQFQEQMNHLQDLRDAGNLGAGTHARAVLSLLNRTESSLGLNQPTRLASAAVHGSAAAIQAINAAQLQQQDTNLSPAERMARVAEVLNQNQGGVIRELQGIRAALRDGALPVPVEL